MDKALGIIEALGFTTAVAALDAASKAAEITLIGTEKIIGLGASVGVSILISGDVAAVQAAVDAGVKAGNKVGRIASAKVIPRPHDELDILIKKFSRNLKVKEEVEQVEEPVEVKKIVKK